MQLFCIKCNIPIEKRTSNGRRLCKEHIIEEGKRYRKKYKVSISNTLKNWRKNNPEYMKEWTKENSDYFSIWAYKTGKDRLESERKYNKNNKEKVKEKARRYYINYKKSGIISKEKKIKIFTKQKNRCNICKEIKKLTIDHIVPVSKGGRNERENLQGLCASCNSRKGNKILSQVEINKILNRIKLCQVKK